MANLHGTEEEVNKPIGTIFEDVPVTLVGEVESLRTETEKHFRLSNGKNIAVAYGMPVHYKNAAGKWWTLTIHCHSLWIKRPIPLQMP